MNVNTLHRLSLGASLALTSVMSFAAIDVTDVTAALGETATPIAAIGGASLLVAVGIKTFKWIRRAL